MKRLLKAIVDKVRKFLNSTVVDKVRKFLNSTVSIEYEEEIVYE